MNSDIDLKKLKDLTEKLLEIDRNFNKSEDIRRVAEEARFKAEEARIKAEEARKIAEETRLETERLRQDIFRKLKTAFDEL